VVGMLSKHYGCPTEFTLDLLGGKWKTIILCYLKEGALRYGELRAFVPRLSEKVLTDRLKELEASGLIARSTGRGSNAASYRLTSRGEALRSVLAAIYHWGNRHATAFGVKCDNPLRTRSKQIEHDP
jgi:DNA-binding HxlR family transcriptional regulator